MVKKKDEKGVECFYCHKKGHVSSECRAKKAAEKGGAVGGVEAGYYEAPNFTKKQNKVLSDHYAISCEIKI